MDEKQEIIKKKQFVLKYLNNPKRLILIAILLLTIAIRLYFYTTASGQTLWWDEAEYMSTAKKWAFDVPYELNPQRPPLFQFLSALAFIIGLGENFIRLAFVILPSILLVLAIYLLGKEMFNDKIGLIAAALASVSWTFLFWTARVQPDFLSMLFQVLAILFMWKYWKQPETKLIALSAFFAALGFYFKVSALLVPMIFMIFIAITDRLSAFKKKDYYVFAAIFLITLVPYFIWSEVTFDNPMGFRTGYTPDSLQFPTGWYNIKFYYLLTEGVTFWAFMLGAVMALQFLLYIDILAREKKKCLDPNIFSILVLVFISAFYIFYIKNTDDRWVFLWMPFIFLLAGKGIMTIYSFVMRYNKAIASIVVIVILAFAMYGQVSHAKQLVDIKKGTYSPVKEAGLWIKENSDENAKVLSISYTQSTYYTERNVSTYSRIENTSAFERYLHENRPDYVQASIFEPHPSWMIQNGMQEGYNYIFLQYFNSTIVSKDGKIVSLDIKPKILHDDIEFSLVYPQNQINGAFVYKIRYEAQ
ncbi:glycosyltransferase family 39 protein [Candidatus Pacearchaeota archaeon]|nr:glycosyltransferase family 39 protein [Candidatus Pacearchaeota archaeon]